MRVLHVLAERGYSGGEHQLRAVFEALAEAGHESVAILNPGARFEETCRALGVPVHLVRMRNDADVVAALRLRRKFRALRADVIHFACSRSHKLGAHASVRMRGLAPRVTTRRMDYPLGTSRYRRWLYGSAVQAVVAVSSGVAREVLATGVAPERVHVIHDGVDYGKLEGLRSSPLREATRAELGARGALLALTSASLHRRKGHDVLLRALARVAESWGDSGGATGDAGEGAAPLVWLFAGDGPERAALEAEAASLALTRDDARVRVRFLGRSEVEPLLAASDLFALPSRKEGLGVALLEAMACGLPVIASAVGGMLDAVTDGTGLLVPPEDEKALASEITRLARDAELRARLGAAARARIASEFTIEAMCARTIALYEQLARRRRGQTPISPPSGSDPNGTPDGV